MSRPGLLMAVAGVLGATAALMVGFGLVYNPILLAAAAPFAAAAYFLWSHATGRLAPRMRERTAATPGGFSGGIAGTERRAGSRDAGPDQAAIDAARVLGVEPDADDDVVRRAFRRRARALHPDAPDGDEAAFRRVREAYEVLRGRR